MRLVSLGRLGAGKQVIGRSAWVSLRLSREWGEVLVTPIARTAVR